MKNWFQAAQKEILWPQRHRLKPPSPFLILIIYTLLTLIMTYPLIFNLTNAVPNDIGDPLLNTWILAWNVHAWLTDPLNLFNANIFHPLPNTLAYSEHLSSAALLVLPILTFSAEPILAYNLSLLTSFPLASYGMYLLTLHWSGQRRAAFIGGIIFGFAPYRFAAIAHLQLLTFQWLPFALLFLDKIIAPKQPQYPAKSFRLYIAFVIFLLLQIWASWYLALYSALIIGIYLFITLLTRRIARPDLIKLIIAFAGVLILTLPFVWPYLALVGQLRQARPLSLALTLAATATDYLAATPFNTILGPLTAPFRTRPGFTEENTLYFSLIAILLASIPFLTWLTRFIKNNSLSNHQSLRPTPYTPHTTHYPLRPTHHTLLLTALLTLLITIPLTFATPYTILANLISTSTIIRVPPRWIIPALFGLSILATAGYVIINSHLSKESNSPSPLLPYSPAPLLPLSIFLICTILLILESLSIPIPLAYVDNHNSLNPAYHWLAQQKHDFTLIELPLHSAPAPEYPEVKRLYASTLGWWPLINGYSGYTPPRQPKLAQNIAPFPRQQSLVTLQTLAFDLAKQNSQLYLLLHPGEAPFDRTQWETNERWLIERNPTMRPLGQFEGDYLYQILPPLAAKQTPVASFGQNQNIHLLAHETNTSTKLRPYQAHMILLWQATTPLLTDYTIFIHLRAADGFVINQADTPPLEGHYPTTAWPAGEIIQDIHPLPTQDYAQVDHIAIGLYNPTSGQRLPVFDATGQRLADDALIIPLQP